MTKTRLAAVAAALLVACAPFGARAADLGGNCCADLEERLSELEATTARKGNRKVTLQVYGQVNETISWHNIDGLANGDRAYIATHGGSPNQLGVRGSAKIGDVTMGYNIEFGYTHSLNGDDAGSIDLRQANWYIDRKNLGRVTVGKATQASKDAFATSLANTWLASKPFTVGQLKTLTAGAVDLPFDGDRKNIVRLDTANFGGFTAAASIANDEEWDVALRYAGEFGGLRLAAAGGYRVTPVAGTSDNKTWGGSASAMHMATGLFLNAGYAKIDGTAMALLDPDMVQLQAGIERKWLDLGKTTLFGEWGRAQSTGADDTTFWGAGFNQEVTAAAMDLYLGCRQYDAGSGVDGAACAGGARIKF